MSLDTQIKGQLAQYLALLEQDVIFELSLGDDDKSRQVDEFVQEIVQMSDKLSVVNKELDYQPSFALVRKDFDPGITFAGLPLGHEFTSFVLALLQVGGRAPKISDQQVARIKKINTQHNMTTFVSLTCHNCPDVVQGLNIISLLNPNVTHAMIEGSMFQDLVEAKGIMAVPLIFDGNEAVASGRQTLDSLIALLAGPDQEEDFSDTEPYDVLVIGGGPAGASAAIYAARKGIRTGIVAKEFGGQVNETLGIENFIGTPYTEGPKLMQEIKAHVLQYPVDIIDNQLVSKIEQGDSGIEVILANGGKLTSRSLILATGARWKDIHVPGEKEFRNKGIAYCAHCDGPLFKGKSIAVIGGGNSGVEAALDLAGIVGHVTVLEFMPELNADKVLQDRLSERDNITVITNAQTTAIVGNRTVNGIHYKDRISEEDHTLDVEGVFIQIGLVPNTEWLKETVDMNRFGEIIVDSRGATNIPGIYAAGDCTDCAYKQIIISMGNGATAALGAYDYLIRQGNN